MKQTVDKKMMSIAIGIPMIMLGWDLIKMITRIWVGVLTLGTIRFDVDKEHFTAHPIDAKYGNFTNDYLIAGIIFYLLVIGAIVIAIHIKNWRDTFRQEMFELITLKKDVKEIEHKIKDKYSTIKKVNTTTGVKEVKHFGLFKSIAYNSLWESEKSFYDKVDPLVANTRLSVFIKEQQDIKEEYKGHIENYKEVVDEWPEVITLNCEICRAPMYFSDESKIKSKICPLCTKEKRQEEVMPVKQIPLPKEPKEKGLK